MSICKYFIFHITYSRTFHVSHFVLYVLYFSSFIYFQTLCHSESVSQSFSQLSSIKQKIIFQQKFVFFLQGESCRDQFLGETQIQGGTQSPKFWVGLPPLGGTQIFRGDHGPQCTLWQGGAPPHKKVLRKILCHQTT